MKLLEKYCNRPGVHCVSTSIRDIFEFNGHKFTEEFVFGLDSGLGFHVTQDPKDEKALFFLGGKRTIFDGSICEAVEVKLIQNRPVDDQKAWEEVKNYIDKDIPVMLQADMYYLDYFKERHAHFGGHMIVLTGYDTERNVAFISERQDDRLGDRRQDRFLTLSLDSLRRARNSNDDFLAPPERKWYVFRFPQTIDVEEGIKRSILKNAHSYLHTGENGLKGLKEFPIFFNSWIHRVFEADLPEEKKAGKVKKQMIYTSSCIEKIGTGGGLFRKMYGSFLKEVYDKYYHLPQILEASEKITQSAGQWTQLSEYLLEAVCRLKNSSDFEEVMECTFTIRRYTEQCRYLEENAFQLLYEWAANT